MLANITMYRTFFAISVLALLTYPLLYIGNYAGDSQVHLIYGQNAAQGAFFEFNLGEKSAGVTSPGYMLLIASFFKAAPDVWVPAIIKATNLMFWYGLIVVVYMVAKTFLRSTGWALITSLAAGLLPGSVYNATNGMENGIFAFLIFVWILTAMRCGWFSAAGSLRDSYSTELLLGALLGLACWFRPEGFVVVAIALGFRAALSIGTRPNFTATMIRSTIFLAPFIVFAGGVAYFHWSETNHLIPISASSRNLMTYLNADTWTVGFIGFSPKMTIRLAQYFPLTIPSLLGAWLVIKGKGDLGNFRQIIGFLVVLFWIFFVLYSFVLSSVHLSRYIIFSMPALVLVGAVGAKWALGAWNWSDRPSLKYAPALTVAILVAALVGVYSAETYLRLELDSQSSLWRSMQAPLEREAFSDELFDQLGRPDNRPISIALQEVQARYLLDQRFIVRSLDGRVDPVLLGHADEDGIDHASYLMEREVQFLLDTPNYNRNPQRWSLKSLNGLKPGEAVSHDGVTFLRMDIDRSNLEQVSQTEAGQWRWFTGENGVIRLHWFLHDLIRLDYLDP
jgi:hypothetical protein